MVDEQNDRNAFAWGDAYSLPLERPQDKALQEILERLIEPLDKDKYKEFSDELRKIYSDDHYRHSYSAINNHLIKTTKHDIKKLSQIADNIKEIYQADIKDDDVSTRIFKLYDHINLEVVQLSSIAKIEAGINSASSQVQASRVAIEAIQKEIAKSQANYITILGIFAAIILAFVSGLAFSTSALNNIDKASIYRLVAIVSLISIFIVNILNFLFSFIKQIHYGKDDKYSKFNPVNCFNIVMLIIILLTALAWYFYHPYEHKTTNNTATINISASDLANCRTK